MNSTERVAVVTGASSGIGRAIANAFANEGTALALVGRNHKRLSETARQCEKAQARARCYMVNLESDAQVRQLAKRVVNDFGGVDALIHSAGIILRAPVLQAKLAAFDQQFRCNLRAPFALTQLLLPTLISRKGAVVFINSTAGVSAPADLSQYSATKHGLKALADSLREEVNPYGVRVLSVYLGRTATPMQEKVYRYEGRPYAPERLIQPEQIAAMVVTAMTLGTEAEVTDIRIRPAMKPS